MHNSNVKTAAGLLAALGLSIVPACLNAGSPSIPWSQIGAKACANYQGDGLAVVASAQGARLCCVFQRLEGEATREGLWLTSSAGNGGQDRFRVVAAAVGRQQVPAERRASECGSLEAYLSAPDCESARLPHTGTVAIDGQTVRFTRPGIVEEYSVSMDGVRQDFVVMERPAGSGELAVRLAVSGAWFEPAVTGARLVLDNSGRKLAYSRLRATDATGRELAARMEAKTNSESRTQRAEISQTLLTSAATSPEIPASALVVVLNDEDAVYPVRIDPTFSDVNWSSFGGTPGVNGPVYVAAVDSAGNLYIGGVFTAVGNTIANNIAEWNGNTWLALGSGITGVTDPNFLTGVFALAVSGSDLYAGGFFTTAGGSPAANIAKWDGNSWSALGSGTDGTYPSVGALAVMGSDLYAGGYFTTAGGSTVNCIAKWDGNSWSPLGTGISGAPDGDVPAVWALAVSGSDLYVGGSFTRAGGSDVNAIAKWDGNSWSALDSGLNGLVFALAASGTDLYAGGSFTTAGGSPANNIAKWDGSSWSPLDSGTAGTTPGTYGYVWALAVLGSDLYAGGSFSTAGGSAANYIAKWNGSKWTPLGSGMDATVRALVVSGSDLYAGGGFTTAGGKVSQSITRAYLLALPTLSVRSATSPAGEVTISWPSAGTDNFSLEQSDAPNTPASWISTSASITDDGITKSVTLPTTSGAQFFRLRRP